MVSKQSYVVLLVALLSALTGYGQNKVKVSNLPVATQTTPGIVKPGSSLTMTGSTMEVVQQSVPFDSTYFKKAKVGSDSVLSLDANKETVRVRNSFPTTHNGATYNTSTGVFTVTGASSSTASTVQSVTLVNASGTVVGYIRVKPDEINTGSSGVYIDPVTDSNLRLFFGSTSNKWYETRINSVQMVAPGFLANGTFGLGLNSAISVQQSGNKILLHSSGDATAGIDFSTNTTTYDNSVGSASSRKMRFTGDGSLLIGQNGGTDGSGFSAVASSWLTVGGMMRGSMPFPPMTGTQRDAISSPVEAVGVYNTTTHGDSKYIGTAWKDYGAYILPVSLSGNGSTTSFTVTHNLGYTPTMIQWTANSTDANQRNFIYATASSTVVTIVYSTAPATGTNNVKGTLALR